MGKELGTASHDPHAKDDDDDEDEETGGGNRLLGFMFGNVDCAGDLDVDYLDEDTKEHLPALVVTLSSSLTDIDLSILSLQTPGDTSEQDYDVKAEDAVDYEDIDEQYEGPETHALSEEDYLLPQKEYLSAEVSLSTIEHRTSVFDEENYDEDDDLGQEDRVLDNSSELQIIASADANFESLSQEVNTFEDTPHFSGSFEDEILVADLEDSQDEPENSHEQFNEKSTTSLPILCVEDGLEVLRFSEIFGIHESLKKGEKRNHRYPVPKERCKALDASDIVEEDEESFLRGLRRSLFTSSQCDGRVVNEGDIKSAVSGLQQVDHINPTQNEEQKKSSLFSEPMKEIITVDLASGWDSPTCPKFYPLDQQDWEDEIIWGNSPVVNHGSSESCTISSFDSDDHSTIETDLGVRPQNIVAEVQLAPNEKDHSVFLHSFHALVEPFVSKEVAPYSSLPFSKSIHPQLLRLESRLRVNDSNNSEGRKVNDSKPLRRGDATRNFSKLSLQNVDMLEDSWRDKIIWETNESISRPKLILDLRDEQMLFEVLETQDLRHLQLHAGAMIVTQSTKGTVKDSVDLGSQGVASVGRFNISNDNYYSNTKSSETDPQQMKSQSKKPAAHGIKVLHSIPALKLQTMKLKLSNKDIANFHRPKALWYPHDNEVAAKEQGELSSKGPMKIILRSIGGKGIKLHVNAEETVSSVKAKASKKLEFKPSEKVQIFYSGKEVVDAKSLAEEKVRPNSLLHLVRTKVHLWPRAQKLPGENKSLRPPGAFKKKSNLSVKDGHVFLMEYCEERPLLLGNVGMAARLCTYYKKSAPDDQTSPFLCSENTSLGNVLTLDHGNKSPFLGDIKPGCIQSCLETNMYRSPLFPHKLSSTDYLLVRSAKGKLSLRHIDRVDVVGQQEPHMEVLSPGTKSLQTYMGNRFLVYLYREFRANEKRGLLPCIRADELSAQFPYMSEPFLRKRLKQCADLQKGLNGQLIWVMRSNFRIPLEEELRRMVTPENLCSYESMQVGIYRLKRLGISRLTHPTGLSSAMNQLPDEAIALAAASHIERELQITPWSLSSNFVACTNQDKENIERLEITGVGDPSGRGLGFSYVRVATKAPLSSAATKKKTVIPRGASTVTGTDADLRRLSMDAAREVLLKFNVPEDEIATQTRWHRIATIRKLSSEQAASGVKVDETTISKYARGGQRMSFTQLQQQAREKCREIWDRQVLSLSAADGAENDSDSEPNSDLDSFAGDLENLLDAEECGTGENYEPKHYKADGVKGLKMRWHSSQSQAEEENEDEAAEAREFCRILMDDDESDRRKKKDIGLRGREFGLGWPSGIGSENREQAKKTNRIFKQTIHQAQPDGSFTSKENISREPQQGTKEKKHIGKPVREPFACGACGQMGHMKTNKNCPRYGKKLDLHIKSIDPERASGKFNFLDPTTPIPQKTPMKKPIPKGATKTVLVETPDSNVNTGSKTKVLQFKLNCGPADNYPDKFTPGGFQSSEFAADVDTDVRPVAKISKIVISNRKAEDAYVEPSKLSVVVIGPTAKIERDQPHKKIKIKAPKGNSNVDQVKQDVDSGMLEDYRKTKMMTELPSSEKQRKQESKRLAEQEVKRKNESRLWEEEERRRKAMREEREMERGREWERERLHEEEMRMQEEQQRLAESRRYEPMWKQEQERNKAKLKRKKKKNPEMVDEYLDELRPSRNDRRLTERNRSGKRMADSGRYGAEYAPQTKRRRGGAGEVGLANILESIVDSLKGRTEVSYLFLKPVSKKEAPDYLKFVKRPMDLSTIKEKVRKMEYKSREDFRHDVWQITYNAHQYNDGRYPAIPPLADQLLELCDNLLDEYHDRLCEAEVGIEIIDT